ncbi:ComEA family DNA-binding protein [Dyella soli]|uniref:Competence protein ComEA n=1 Tax=Dyella soli TaxID=522319 RepID=A0A4V2NLX8_9GAMM|nr:helix-hairpin-helix domain-containing protein [Dyella soli]TCI10851.1 competence protein ComEA [Dyella soli]
MLHKIAACLIAFALSLPVFAATPVNVNKADAATLAKSLDGVGATKAAAIVAWREEKSPFKSVDDLSQVKGIGPATLQRNRDAILLSDGPGDNKAAPAKAAPARAKPSRPSPSANNQTSQ